MDISYDFNDLFFGIGMDGKALMREEFQNIDTNQKKIKLMYRYKYLYDHSYVILGMILSSYPNSSFYDELASKTNLILPDIDICLYDKEDGLNLGEVLEEFLLSDNDLEKTILYRYVGAVWSSSPRMRGCKKKSFITSKNAGFSEYDEAIKFILDFTYSFIKSQQARKTYVYEKDSNGKYVPANSIVHGCKTVYDVDILEKLEVLDKYYDILSFVNRKDEELKFSKGIDYEMPNAEKTLVSYNPFIKTFASDLRTRGSVWENDRFLSFEQKKDIYFSFHDEIPFDYEVKCSREECNNSYGFEEDDIFYMDGTFKTICPCCGSINQTKLPNIKTRDKISERVINRAVDDTLLEDKIKLLSELTALGGVSLVKEKVKRK